MDAPAFTRLLDRMTRAADSAFAGRAYAALAERCERVVTLADGLIAGDRAAA